MVEDMYIPNVVQKLKGISSRMVMNEFEETLKKEIVRWSLMESFIFCSDCIRKYKRTN